MCRLNIKILPGQCNHPFCNDQNCDNTSSFSKDSAFKTVLNQKLSQEVPEQLTFGQHLYEGISTIPSKGIPTAAGFPNLLKNAFTTNFQTAVQSFNLQFDFIMKNNEKCLSDLSASYQKINTEIVALTNEIKIMKADAMHIGGTDSTSSTLMQSNSDHFLQQMYGGANQFKYQIATITTLEQPLYRERNFKMDLRLADMSGSLICNTNKIKVEMALYTNETPPKKLEINTAGKPIFKGNIIQEMYKSKCMFERIHLKEVSSHFRGGWVFLVVKPLIEDNHVAEQPNLPLGVKKGYIDPALIKPLIIEKVVVKAKKLKKNKIDEESFESF